MATHVVLLLAFLCFLLATFNAQVKVNLVALGLALWVLTLVMGRL